MDTTIFYSWQSDDSKTRSYIEKALKKAIASISESPNLYQAPRLDKDTQDTAGAVHIVDTIKRKIDNCGVFLADVSLVDSASSGRSIVNQNVMFELGYAIGKHSESRVIMVANKDLRDINKLPFDISHHRVIQFSPGDDKQGVKFRSALESAINIHLESLEAKVRTEASEPLKEKLIDAIENNKPTRLLSKKYFEELYGRYLEFSPKRYNGGNIQQYGGEVYRAYAETRLLTVELFDVIEIAAEYKNLEVLKQVYKSLELISVYYDIVPEDNGHMWDYSKEYPVLVVNEIVSVLMGVISQAKLWSLLKEINEIKLKRSENYNETRTLKNLNGYPKAMYNYFNELKNMQYVLPMTPLLQERFSEDKNILQAYLDGDVIRYYMLNTAPWSVGLLLGSNWTHYVPDFLTEFGKLNFVQGLKSVTKEASFEDFKKNIWNQSSVNLANWRYHNDNLIPALEYAGIKSVNDIAGFD